MRTGIGYHTGAFKFDISFVAQNTSGSADISFGLEGSPEEVFSFRLEKGNLIDSDGIYFGGYLPYEENYIKGICEGNRCSYYYNGLPSRINYEIANTGIDYIEITKDEQINGTYEFSYYIIGNPS